MKQSLALYIGVVWLAARAMQAAPLEPGLVAQVHFAGGAAVAADPNSAALKHLWSSPEALALRNQTADKLARSLDVWLRRQITPTLTGPVALQPLLEDLGQSEWLLDLRQPTPDTLELALSVRLGTARSQVWLNTLTPVLSAWNAASPRHHAHFVRTGEWWVLTLGNSPAPTAAGVVPGLKGIWLTADVDWTRLAAWYPKLRKLDLPQTRLQVIGRNGNFEIAGNLFLARPLSALGAWQLPTDSIHAPLSSFTAARGISSWLKQQPWAVSLGLSSLPDQVFTWAMPQVAYEVYAAVPLASAVADLPKLEQSLATELQAGPPGALSGTFKVENTNGQVIVGGMPFATPHFEAKRERSGEFLEGGFFAISPRGQPVPAELLAPLAQPGLVYYHWENTADRMRAFPQLYQLLFMVSRDQQLGATSVGGQWLNHLAPSLGPTVTRAFEVSPTELGLTRQAPAGLTAVELVALASWLEAPDFPGCNLQMPPPKPHRHLPKPSGGAAPFILH